MQPVLPIVFALAVQQIPLQAGMTLTYVHRNFDRNRDDEIRTWIVRMTAEESVWNAEWVANPCPGPEDHMSRREQLGARSMDFARGGTADQTVAEHRPHTLYMLSARLLRGARPRRAAWLPRAAAPPIRRSRSPGRTRSTCCPPGCCAASARARRWT